MLNKTIYEDGNGGQLTIINNDVATTDSLLMMAYIAMFGGNREASTTSTTTEGELNLDWWGNDREENSSTWINSETEKTLIGIQLNSSSIETIKQAILTDLDFMDAYGDLSVAVSITDVNTVKMHITLNQGDNLSLIWDSTKNEVIQEIWL